MPKLERLRPWWKQFSSSFAFKLSIIYGVSGLMMALFVLAFIYLQIMGALHAHHYRQVDALSKRIQAIYEVRGRSGLLEALRYDLNARSHLSSDLLIMVDQEGKKILGNLDELPPDITGFDYFPELRVSKNGRWLEARLKKIRLEEGDTILVGRDLTELGQFRNLIGRTSFLAVLFGLLFTVISTYWFRYELGESAASIRRTAEAIRAGRFKQRIPVHKDDHELNLLGKELNRMLDYMENSLQGVRHVSDTIAHNLRTPLMRLRALLGPAARPQATQDEQRQAIHQALDEISHLTTLFDKLLYIAELESGVQRQNWKPLNIHTLLTDVVDLYEPLAAEQQVRLHLDFDYPARTAPWFLGDADLLMSALSNLVDNAIKFTQDQVWLRAWDEGGDIVISIRDNGPGVPEADREQLGRHFYRAAQTSDKPGTGLGLTSVFAITKLLRGEIQLLEAHPGLEVRLIFPSPRENDNPPAPLPF